MKHRIILIFSILLLLGINCFGQQTITFQKALIQPDIQELSSVVQTPDNGYIAVGRKRESPSNYVYVVRFNIFGDTIWTKKLSGFYATDIIQTVDNNYAICRDDGLLYKIDLDGNVLTTGSFSNPDASIGNILQLDDGSYFLCGALYPIGYPYLLKYNTNGNLLWDTLYTKNIFTGYFADVVLSPDNNLVLAGSYKRQSNLPNNFFLMKTDLQGNQIWFTSVENYFYPSAYCLVKTQNGDFFVGGSYNDNDVFIAKFNAFGQFQWLTGFDTTSEGISNSITNSFDGNLVYVGWNYIDTLLYVTIRKIDTNGNTVWFKRHRFEDMGPVPFSMKQTSDSGFVVVGKAHYQNDDCYILKTDKIGEIKPIGVVVTSSEVPSAFNLYQNFPNPFNPETHIRFDISQLSFVTLRIYDITGKEISNLINKILSPSKYSLPFSGEQLSTGVYFYQLIASDPLINAIKFTSSKKLLILK